MKVLSIFGTRPEAIKMAPVVRELRKYPEIEARVCVTGQHREMLDQVLQLFEIMPDYDLNVMQPNQQLAATTARVLDQIDPVLVAERPDWVLVQGDTTTAMGAALAAFYRRIAVGHVEAGLRTHDKYQPFPEEINRRIADAVAEAFFAPTAVSRQNLLSENLPGGKILVTGNTVIDALLQVVQKPFVWEESVLRAIPALAPVILVTAHRRENFGEGIENICHALAEIAARHPELYLVYPVHLNPNIQTPVARILGSRPNILLTAPMDYLSLAHLMKRARIVITDSGGLQEEAPSLGKPVLVLRDVTERPEAVQAGTVKLVGTDRARIVAETERLLNDTAEYEQMARAVNPYGDGHASERIVGFLRGESVQEFLPARTGPV
ncbi:MAG: UDP-N-acetylglucosamine 2-epimerase (non-hydrolyzing) [Anaerolineae bacterium]